VRAVRERPPRAERRVLSSGAREAVLPRHGGLYDVMGDADQVPF
jgi:hypothetical protein